MDDRHETDKTNPRFQGNFYYPSTSIDIHIISNYIYLPLLLFLFVDVCFGNKAHSQNKKNTFIYFSSFIALFLCCRCIILSGKRQQEDHQSLSTT